MLVKKLILYLQRTNEHHFLDCVAVIGSSSPLNAFHFSYQFGFTGSKWMHPPEALLRGHIVYNVKVIINITSRAFGLNCVMGREHIVFPCIKLYV